MGGNTYHGEWRSYWEMFGSFCGDPRSHDFAVKASTMPHEDLVVYAEYNLDGFEGSSVVVYVDFHAGSLMANFSDHCSCNGLEWHPEPTSTKALLKMNNENLATVIKQRTKAISAYLGRG